MSFFHDLDAVDRRYDAARSDAEWLARLPAKLRPFLGPARYKGLYGGRGGMKSHFFAEMLIRRCEARRTRWLCVREVQKSLTDSVKQLLEDKLEQRGTRVPGWEILDTVIRTPFGGHIKFVGMQNHTADSVKSFEGFDGAWVEEAHSLSLDSLNLLTPTIRKDGSEIWFSWNPQHSTDPVDAFLRGEQRPPNSLVEAITWEENPYLPATLRQEAEWCRQVDPDRYAYVWGGGYKTAAKGRVLTNWRVDPDLVAPSSATFYFGGDWGFATDPTAGLRCWLVPEQRRLYVDHVVGGVGVELDDTPALFDSLGCAAAMQRRQSDKDADALVPDLCPKDCKAPGHGSARRWTWTADSSRPETIAHVKKHGYARMQPAVKGPGSVEDGLEFLRSVEIVVHPRCAKLIKELRFYAYKIDRTSGQVLPELVDKDNHWIDALRYALEDARRNGKGSASEWFAAR